MFCLWRVRQGRHALLNTTVGSRWAKRLNGNTMPCQTRLYFPKYTLRLTVNVCFIMAGVQIPSGADHVPFCKIAHSTMLC